MEGLNTGLFIVQLMQNIVVLGLQMRRLVLMGFKANFVAKSLLVKAVIKLKIFNGLVKLNKSKHYYCNSNRFSYFVNFQLQTFIFGNQIVNLSGPFVLLGV